MDSTVVTCLRRLLAASIAFSLALTAAMVRTKMRDPVSEAASLPSTRAGREQAVLLYREALERDNASAYRWADLAEALGDTGHLAEARQCFTRAMVLAPAVPQIWVRHANFSFINDDPRAALASAARVLATTPDYDGVLFNDFDRMVEDPAAVIDAIGGQPRAMESWLKHLISVHDTESAELAWKRLSQMGHPDAALANAYVGYLLGVPELQAAVGVWSEWLGKQRGEYPQHNLLFNGGFQAEPTGSPLDWSIAKPADDKQAGLFETTRESGGVRIQFNGKDNVNYDGLSQTAVLPHAGRYQLTARVKTENITTNEGPRLAVTDLGIASDAVTGTGDWTVVTLQFAVAKPRTIRVAVVRRPSEKFDNKIQGTVLVSEMRLAALSRP